MHRFEFEPRKSPATAAMLSIIPGLGQLYNGETRKGLLFLEASAINFALLWMVFFSRPILETLIGIGNAFHIEPNKALIHTLESLRFGGPLSVILLGLALAFLAYAVRDAYDQANYSRRQKLYPEFVIPMPEATSGSYLFHFAVMLSCVVLALFFVKPAPPRTQVTEIEFVQTEKEEQPPEKTKVKSTNNAQDKGVHTPDRPVANNSSNRPVTQSRPAPTQDTKPSVKPDPAPPKPLTPQPVRPTMAQQPAPPAITPVAPLTPRLPAPGPTLAPAQAQAPRVPTMPIPVTAVRTPAMPVPTTIASAPTAPLPLVRPNLPVLPDARQPVAPVAIAQAGTLPGPIAPRTTSGSAHSLPGPIVPVAGTSAAKGSGSEPQPIPVVGQSGARSHTGAGTQPAPSHLGSSNPGTSTAGALASLPVGRPGDDVRPTNPGTSINPREPAQAGARADVNFGPYMAELQRRIKRSWFPPKDTETKRVVVVFKIHRDGSLSHLRLDRGSGIALADQAALKAVENAAPFGPLPAGADENVDIQFTFDYNVFGGGGQGKFRHF